MIFPQYDYKSFHNGNKSEWALQPPTIENWCKMVNKAFEYCKTIIDINDFEGRCNDYDLPYNHPYWGAKVKESDTNHIANIKGQISEIEKLIIHNHNHKYIGNMHASIKRMELLLKQL